MKTRELAFLTWILLPLIAMTGSALAEEAKLSLRELENKVRGGWAGQMIGVAVGGPTEFRAQASTYDKPLSWDPKLMRSVLRQDDLYVEMTFCQVLDTVGLDAEPVHFGVAFGLSRYRLWHANLVGRHNIRHGIMPPDSGHPKYNAHADDIDFQIEADFIGLMCPGMPWTAAQYADRVGHVMNYGDGVYGGVFVSAMYAAAFFERDPRKIVEVGARALHPRSKYGQLIRDILDVHQRDPDNWLAAWTMVEEKWANRDACPYGALRPFDIDAKTNGGYIAIGLLYGGGDFKRTIEIATRCGQDSDCNPANAGGILGVALGYDALPKDWQKAAEDLGDEKFSYTEYSFNDIVKSTVERAKKLVVANGGRVTEDAVIVRCEEARPLPTLEQWDHGRAVKRIDAADAAWSWKGNWEKAKRGEATHAESNHKGDEASLTFEGSGVIVLGTWANDAGIVEAYLDGKRHGRTNLYENDRSRRDGESVFHVFGLEPREHEVRLLVTGEKSSDARDAFVRIEGAVIFEPERE